MSADLVDWHDEHELDHRRRLRNSMLVSLAIHGLLVGIFAFSPAPHVAKMPDVISVDLIGPSLAAPKTPEAPKAPQTQEPSAAPKAPPAAAPKPPAPAPPAPEPPPEPEAPAPPPPAPKAPVQVIPEEAPSKIAKVEPKPKAEPKPKPRPKPEPKPPPRPRTPEKELSHEDALAALMEELGGDEVSDSLQRAPSREEPAEPETSGGKPGEGDGQNGAQMDADLARWAIATHRRIQDKWVTLPKFRGRGLATVLELRLSASGGVIGEPKIAGSSGDPYFDENAVRGVLQASPLPAPPRAGPVTFIFRSDAE